MRPIHHAVAATIVAALAPCWAAPLYAQAWLPARGEGTASVLFTNVFSKDHLLPDERHRLGEIDSNSLLFEVTYGLTDRVAVNVGLPVVMARYRGNFPHRPITLDDGRWHSAPQDFRFGLRYNMVRGRALMVTPFIGSDLPSHNYEFYTHAAPGRGLKELHAGVAAGRLFADAGLVVQGRYSHTISERALDQFARRYSVVAVEAAYFLTPSVRVLAMSTARLGHTGIDLSPTAGRDLPFELFYQHDRISRESYWNLGGGAAVSLTDRLDVFGAFTRTLSGRNTHAVNRGLSLGLSWSFGQSGEAALIARDAREGTLVRCLCQKAAD